MNPDSKPQPKDLLLTIVSMFLHVFDVYSDYLLGITYFLKAQDKRDYAFGFLTLLFAVFPAILNGIKVLANRKKCIVLRNYLPKWFCIGSCILLQARLALLISIGSYQVANIWNKVDSQKSSPDSTTPSSGKEKDTLNKASNDRNNGIGVKAYDENGSSSNQQTSEEVSINDLKVDVALTETFIGALPQFIVQMYIVTQVKRVVTVLQFISMLGSICGATFSFSSRFQAEPSTKGIIFFLSFLLFFTRINTLVLSTSLWRWMPLFVVTLHLITVALMMRFFHCCFCGKCGGDNKRNYNRFVFILRRWHNIWIPTSTGCTLFFSVHMFVENAIIISFSSIFFPAENIPENYIPSSLFYNRIILHLNLINPALFILYTWLLLGLLQLIYVLFFLIGKLCRATFYRLMDEDDFHVGRFTC